MPDLRAVILSTAKDFVRRQTPYLWGGASANATDCSGLSLQCYRAAGIELGRTTWQQFDQCRLLDEGEVKPADLVFFDVDGVRNSHVGIVSGPGYMIDAPSEGNPVREEAIWTNYPHRYARHPALDGPEGVPAAVSTKVIEQPFVRPTDDKGYAVGIPVGALAEVTASDGLNLRGAPTMAGTVLGLLQPGQRVFVAKAFGQADGHTWREVAAVVGEKALTGFSAETFLRSA